MLKEFVKHIQDTAQAQIVNLDGHTYAVDNGGDYEEVRPPVDRPDLYHASSLDALVKLVKTEGILAETPLYITVPSPLTVECAGSIRNDPHFVRRTYYKAFATDVPGFQDGYRDQETAIIQLRSQFEANEGTEYLLDLLSRISKDSSVTSNDNGVSQEVKARTGVSLKCGVKVRPIVPLRPYRTFQEVAQPESDFLLRLDGEGRVGLFEADGGMWKLKARETVKAFLEDKLQHDIEIGTVIVAL